LSATHVLSSRVYELSRLAAGPWPAGHPDILRLLERTEKLASDVLLAEQLVCVQKLIEHAQRSVPFHTKRLERAKKVPLGELDLTRFSELVPILSRAELRDGGRELTSTQAAAPFRPNGVRTTTSGSTGRPVTTEGSHVSGVLATCQQDRFHRWHRRDPTRVTAFITKPEVPKKPGHWTALGRGPAVHFSLARPTGEQLEWLARERPSYLVSYPSNVRALARASLELGVTLPGLVDVTVSSEPISDELRALVQRAWGARLVATYSANEVGAIALEGASGEYLVQSEFVLVEILRADGSPVAPGEVGRVVVTALHEAHRPLLRYEIGDYAELGRPPSGPIGLPRLGRVMGRERNLLKLPGGGEVWPYFELAGLAELRALRQWQIVQRSLADLEVRIVVGRPLDADEQGAVRSVVERSLPGRFQVALRVVEEIPRGPGGKYEEFVSALDGTFRDWLG
jgi:phenylacetate-CoA ligase